MRKSIPIITVFAVLTLNVSCEYGAEKEQPPSIAKENPERNIAPPEELDRFVKVVEEDAQEESQAVDEARIKKGKKMEAKPKAVNKALSSDIGAAGSLKNIFQNKRGSKGKINVGMSGLSGAGKGAGGMGVSGAGRGGGGIGFGRIGGLGSRSGPSTGARMSRGRGIDSLLSRNTESYKKYKVNEHTKTSDDKFSTFSIDVDTASYTIGRKKLNAGYMPPAASVRPEEYLNYFKYDYAQPKAGAFAVHLEGAPTPFSIEKNKYILRVGVQGKRLKSAERKPVHLTFLVDVSGSMSSRDKLPLAQKSLRVLVDNLKKGDTVALSTYAGNVRELLPPTGVEKRSVILAAIRTLRSGGGTGMSSGMESAYKSAMKNFKKSHVNRVIVLSDGDANIGPKSHKQILSRIRHFAQEGISLSTIGFGMGNYKDTMMEQLANKGNGNYYYVDSVREAKKVFGEQLDGTMQIIAKDVKIQVEFDPAKVKNYRLIGYENRDIADEDFRNDRVDAGEIGAGHSVTALYEISLVEDAIGKLATVRVRAKKPDGETASELAFAFNRSDLRTKLSDASNDFQFQMGVVEFAEVLRKSPYAEGLTLALVREVITPTIGKSAQRQELLALVNRASKLRK